MVNVVYLKTSWKEKKKSYTYYQHSTMGIFSCFFLA